MPRFRNTEDQRYYTAAKAAFKAAGLSRQQLDAAVQWYEGLRPGMSRHELMASFSEFAGRHGWDERAIGNAVYAYDGVASRGPEYFMRSNDRADQAIIDRAENLMHSDFAAYSHDIELQEDYQEALERAEARGSLPDMSKRLAPEPPSGRGDMDRRREIEQAMREDGGRAYWSDPHLQAEYARILAGDQAPADRMDPRSIGTDMGAQPTGGATVSGF